MRLTTFVMTLTAAALLPLTAFANCGMAGCTHAEHDEAHAAEHSMEQAAAPADHPLFRPYEAIRRQLMADSTAGAAAHAKELAANATKLRESIADDTEAANEARALLREIAETSTALAAASGLDATREAFHAASKPLVRYRELVTGAKPLVVYCPMAKKSWLQPDEPIGNPYYGSSMLRCGKIVSQ